MITKTFCLVASLWNLQDILKHIGTPVTVCASTIRGNEKLDPNADSLNDLITKSQCTTGAWNSEAGKSLNRDSSPTPANKIQEGEGKNQNLKTGKVQVKQGKDPETGKAKHEQKVDTGTLSTKTNSQRVSEKHSPK